MREQPTADQIAFAAYAKARFPKITSYGFSVPPGCEDAWADGLQPCHVAEFNRAMRFLDGLERVKPRRDLTGSYVLKHMAERWAGGYIREGALILAALTMNIEVKPYGWPGHGGYIGVGKRSVAERLSRETACRPFV